MSATKKAKYRKERAFITLSFLLLLNLCLIMSIGFKSDDVVFTREKGGEMITHRDLKSMSKREVKKQDRAKIEEKGKETKTEIVKIPTKTDRVKIEGDKKTDGVVKKKFRNTKEFIEAFKKAGYQEKINIDLLEVY